MIDKEARISSEAKIGENCKIGPNAYIGEGVVLGNDVTICANAYLEYCEIGDGTFISPFASVGTPPQDLGYKNERTKVIIGKNCQIREYATVNRASGEGKITQVGDNCLLMTSSHVAHNCKLEDGVILANLATLGGHITVGKGAFIGGMSVFHQNIRIGEMCIVSGFSASRLDILPYSKGDGRPPVPKGINSIGLKRRGFSLEERTSLNKAIKILTSEHHNTSQAIEIIKNEVEMNKYVQNIIDFVNTSKRGVLLRYAKDIKKSKDENDEI